jgi:hypothetical protein
MISGPEKQVAEAREKVSELWGNRRKFLTKSTLGSAAALSGGAMVAKGVVEMALSNAEPIVESPLLLLQIPDQIEKIPKQIIKIPDQAEKAPHYIEEAAEYIPQIPKEVKDFVIYSKNEIASTKVTTATCYNTFSGEHTDLSVDLPFIDGASCLFPEDRIVTDDTLPAKYERLKYADQQNTAPGVSAVILGGALVGTGVVFAKSERSEILSRRKLLDRARTGATYEVFYSVLNSSKK